MRNTFLTVDLEEWYDLEYLKDYNLKQVGVEVIPQIIDFLDALDAMQIKATFFIVAEVTENNTDIIREIYRRGHEIACHGLNHQLLYEKTSEQYYNEIVKAKEIIEQAIKCEVKGYRAACFSMDREKLDLTRKAGYSYDSSMIRFEWHPLYRNLDLTGFEKVDDLVYKDNEFYEHEIPTLKLGKYNIPISGGGYIRLFPYFVLKILIKKHEKTNRNFLLYLHPFELTNTKLLLPKKLNAVTKFRCLVGRKHNLKKIKKMVKYLKKRGNVFRKLADFETAGKG